MTKNNLFLASIIFYIFQICSPGFSQVKEKDSSPNKNKEEVIHDSKYVELLKKASQYYLHEHYHFALPVYMQLLPMNPEDYEINFRLGICHLNTFSKSNSIKYLEKAKTLETKDEHKDLNFFLAQAYQVNHEFDKAIKQYETYKTTLNPNNEFDSEMIGEVTRLMEQCNHGKKLCAQPVNIKIDHLNTQINSPYSESYPLITADGKTLYFSSGRPATTGGKYDFDKEQYYHDIYFSTKENGKWSLAKQLKGGINTTENDSPLSISKDGNRMFIYTSLNGDGDIFYSDHKDSVWSSLKDMGENINSPEFENGGCISPDGKSFYFSSDREEGFGGYDIYKSILLADGSWGIPVNVGPLINTPYDEADPFILNDGTTLYFSSKGHNSMGGYDIFASKFDLGHKSWTTPVNMGYPLNTADDQVSISWSSDGSIGYFAQSDEKGYGKEDIYAVSLAEAPKVSKEIVPVISHVPAKPKTVAVTASYSNKPKIGDVLKEQVHFAFNETHKITEYSKNKIAGVLALMQKYPDLVIEIEGFADNSSNHEYNIQVSEKRAKAVYDYMIRKGVSAKKLQTKIYRENQSTTIQQGTSEKNINNRRVEFKVVNNNGGLTKR